MCSKTQNIENSYTDSYHVTTWAASAVDESVSADIQAPHARNAMCECKAGTRNLFREREGVFSHLPFLPFFFTVFLPFIFPSLFLFISILR